MNIKTAKNTWITERHHCLFVYGCWATHCFKAGGAKKCWSNKVDSRCSSGGDDLIGYSQRNRLNSKNTAERCIHRHVQRASENWAGSWMCTFHISILSEFLLKTHQTHTHAHTFTHAQKTKRKRELGCTE